jgi:hypothetical protein
VTVSAPSDNVRFERIKAVVHGRSVCLGACGRPVNVTLANARATYAAEVVGGSIEFPAVELGQYELSVKPDRTEEWAVEVSRVVVRERVLDIGEVIRQKAWLFNLTVSHDMAVRNGDAGLTLRRGLNAVRLDASSTVIEPGDCHQFAPVDVRSQQRIIVKSVERRVIVRGDGPFEVFVNGRPLPAPFTFSQVYDDVVNVSVASISPWYAEPPNLTVPPVVDCSEGDIVFDVVRGVEFAGRIIPPIAGVLVRARSEAGTVNKVVTNETGHCSLGSYATNLPVTLTASKSGYRLARNPDSFDFTAEKLGHATIAFERNANADDKGIILSLSRSDGFAQNVVVESADEAVTIHDLEAGEYFLKPVFREHQFTPTQISLALAQGETFAAISQSSASNSGSPA